MSADFSQIRYERLQKAIVQQHQAANPAHSVWVSASAGTGKTRVLSDRVLRMLLKKIDAGKILCLTYTKAAAAEMKTRIFERLSEWAVTSDAKLEKSLTDLLGEEVADKRNMEATKQIARTRFAQLLDTPGGIKIQTIHSFCQEVLKRFPLEADILPYFDIMEDRESDEILHSLQNKMQREAELEPDTPLSLALQYLNTRLDEKSFPQVMKSITEKRTEIADLLNRCANTENLAEILQHRLGIKPQDSVEKLMQKFVADTDIDQIKQYLPLWKSGQTQCDADNSAALEKMLQHGFLVADFNDYCKIFSAKNIAGTKLRRACPDFDKWIETEVLRVASCKKQIMRQNLYESTVNVLIVAGEFINRYEDYKYRTGKMDYTDLILVTRRLLQNSSMADWVLFKLDGGIDHILIDEAQDTSPVQWDIVQALCAEFWSGEGLKENATVFAVGDRKQSIFSFQGADPDRYDAMAQTTQSNENRFQKVDLAVSFRSAPAVLDVVNRIFSSPEMANGVIGSGENVAHIAYRAGEFGNVQIWPFMFKSQESKTSKNGELPLLQPQGVSSLKKQMAEKIVAEIARLITESQNGSQPLHYSDFMVLVQRRSSIVTEFIRACKSKGIPVTGADKLILSKEIAVQDLLSLGKFLLLPDDDLSLAEVLKSPFCGLTDDELTPLCYNRGATSLWIKLLQKQSENKKYQNACAFLQKLLQKVDFVRPFELYNEVLTVLNGRYLMTQRMGMEVEDAIDEFMSLTLSYEKENIPTLQGFINRMEETDIEIKREVDRADVDAVRLMTVHHSKGLQAPIVFLADAGFVKNLTRGQGLLLDKDTAYYPLNANDYEDNCERVLDAQKQKALEESKRLLYVALTRAEDRLYVCGFQSGNGTNVPQNSWYNMCQAHLPDENGHTPSPQELWEYQTPAFVAKKQKQPEGIVLERQSIESWMNEPVAEVSALAKPYTPSKPVDEDELDSASPLADTGNYYRRGTIIHKLLQFLPQTTGEKEVVALEFLRHHAPDMTEDQHLQIVHEVTKLLNLPEYFEIFGAYARSEVPIMGVVGEKIISAQLDKLVVLPHKVMIVDFKTNRPAAPSLETTPKAYVTQLESYAELVHRIYPNLPVEAYILWTNVPRLMRVV